MASEVERGRSAVEADVTGLHHAVVLISAGRVEVDLGEQRPKQLATAAARADELHATQLTNSTLGDAPPQSRRARRDQQHHESRDDPDVEQKGRRRKVGALEHDVSKRVDRVRQRQHIRDRL